jgi:hypothetical protein
MNAAIHIPTTGSPQERVLGICQRMLAQITLKLAMVLVIAIGLTGTALAIDQPPETASQQRAWLLSHLVTDMQSVGTFQSGDIGQMVTLVNSLTDDQISLLTRFYYLTREKTEQDAQLYAVQQTDTDEALAQAKAQVADLLTQLQNQIEQTYSELAASDPGCQTLCQIAYASVPGWCAYNQYAIPDWYYNNGCYVGPVYSANYCGAYAAPVYNTFYNRGSRYNYWNSRNYLHNNSARIGHYGTSRVRNSQQGFAVTAHHNSPQVLKYNNPLPKVNHAFANHNTPTFHNPASLAKNHTGSHAQQARPANHPKPQTLAHNHSKSAAAPKAHAQAHAAPHPHAQHVTHASHPQHAAQAHASSGHGRHK